MRRRWVPHSQGAEAWADHRPLPEPRVVSRPYPGVAVADLADLAAGGDRSLLQERDSGMRSRRPEQQTGDQRPAVSIPPPWGS
jgi:hypothetical protein